jgi:hypothetical protein
MISWPHSIAPITRMVSAGVLLSLASLWIGPTVQGQPVGADTSSLRRTAITASLGTVSTPTRDLTVLLRAAHTRGWHRLSGRVAGAFDVFGGGQSDLAVQYGPALSWPWGQISVAGGPSLVWGERDGSSDHWAVPGLALGGTLYLTPPIGYGTFGIGVSGFANVNEEQPIVGLTFGIVVGDLR